MRWLLPLLLCFACTELPPDPEDVPDWRGVPIGDREIPPAPPAGQGFQIVTPVLTVPPNSEVFFCYYGTYDGPTVGVNQVVVHQDPQFSHHALLKEGRDDEIETRPDGTVVDCSSLQEQTPARPTLFESVAVGLEDDHHDDDDEDEENIDDWMEGEDYVFLPPELAFRFEHGKRWVADVHFVNWSDEEVRTRAVFDLWTVPVEQVEHFVGTFNHDAGGFDLAPHQETTLNFTCEFPEEITILSLGGHMHSWGAHYRVDEVVGSDVVRERVFEVPEWTPDMRFEPTVNEYEPGEFDVAAGHRFRSWCTWNNTEDRSLAFPDEMCTTFGVGYPIEQSDYCIATGTHDSGPPP